MHDFDLSEALDSSSDSDDIRCESRCFDTTDVQNEVFFRLEEGLDLVVSRNPKTLQSAAYLLLAANRMKKSLNRCGRELRDDELCSAIMDSLVTETVVVATDSLSTAVQRTYQRINSEERYTLCDISKKDVVQVSGDLKLQAITLSGGNCERKVKFKLARYVGPFVPPGQPVPSDQPVTSGQPVLLSITDTNLHICCSMKDGKAVLNLEECSVQNLKMISEAGDMDRFLFYKTTTGISLTTFESVKYRGWFISTSCEDERQPVEMCTVDADRRVTCFQMN